MAKEDQAMDAYTKCFAKEAPSQSWFAAAVKKAQSQLELLPRCGLTGNGVPEGPARRRQWRGDGRPEARRPSCC